MCHFPGSSKFFHFSLTFNWILKIKKGKKWNCVSDWSRFHSAINKSTWKVEKKLKWKFKKILEKGLNFDHLISIIGKPLKTFYDISRLVKLNFTKLATEKLSNKRGNFFNLELFKLENCFTVISWIIVSTGNFEKNCFFIWVNGM